MGAKFSRDIPYAFMGKKFLEFDYKIGITFMLIGVILIYILVLTGVWNY